MTRRTGDRVLSRIALCAVAVGWCGPTDAQVVRQLTDLRRTETTLAGLDDAGTRAFAFSSSDPYGSNPTLTYQLFHWDPATGAGEQVTAFPGGVVPSGYGPSVSDDGQLVAFLSSDDPAGGNADHSVELFLIGADGSGLVQLTSSSDPADYIGKFALAGNGSRLVFESNSDYLGTNPARVGQLWVVEADGTGLRQITSHTLDELFLLWPVISDDGTRIAYTTSDGVIIGGDWQVFGVLHDGTGRRQITAEPYLQPTLPAISGDGSTIAFETRSPTLRPPPGGCWGSPGQQIALVDWDGSDLHLVTGICLGSAYPGVAAVPDITDDAQTVFYAANEFSAWAIERVNRDGTGRTFLTDLSGEPGPPARCTASRTAGAGGRVAFWCDGGEPWGGPNLDLSRELYAMTGVGTAHRQFSSDVDGDSLDPDLTPDGTSVVFVSDANPLGEPGYWHRQLYRMAPDGSGLARISSFDHGTPKQPSIRDDGGLIVFAHDGDPLGTNGYRSYEIFAIGADGTGLRQLTPDIEGTFDPSDGPELSGDGSVVVFQSVVDLLGEGLGGWKVYRVDPDGSGLARLSGTGTPFEAPNPRVDAGGSWVVYAWEGRIHRQRTDGSGDQTITASAGAAWPDVAPGGELVIYASSADPLGSNPEGNVELFLWEAAGSTTTQLTATAAGVSTAPSFDRAASWVYFWSDAAHLGEPQVGYLTPFRVEVSSGLVQRVGGLVSCVLWADWDPLRPVSVDGAGRRAAFGAYADCTGINRDGSGEVVLIDRNAPARIRVSPGPAPTVISWDVESGPLRYDVIRGDLASLAFSGGAVDLGVVTCIEDDSTDASTEGDEDLAEPPPGQAFFYLQRGTQGAAAGPGSYGAASSGEERTPAGGDCPV